MVLRSWPVRGRLVGLVVLLASLPAPVLALAQEAAPTDAITVVAGGLAFPRGFAWDANGVLHVALAGNGETGVEPGSGQPPDDGDGAEPPTAPAVVRIENGCGVPAVVGLPSTRDPYGDHQGPTDVAFLDGQLYVLQDAAGTLADVGPDFPNGLYAANAEGGVRLVADVTAYANANQPTNVYHLLPLGEPFAMVPGDDEVWAVDANRGELLRLGLDGAVERFADLSLNHPVQTAIALAPGGGFYVGFLGASPHADGTSKIVKVTADGAVSDVWTGLTMVSGVAVAPDGTLYALEMATGNSASAPFIFPSTGRIVRQTGPASQEEVVAGLDYPVSMAFGPDGGLYVALPAIAPDGTLGGILRVDPSLPDPLAMPPDILATSACAAASPAAAAPGASPLASPVALTPTAAPTPTTAPETPAAASPTGGTPEADPGKREIGGQAVTIQNFAYDPPTLNVPAGTLVNWTNRDGLPHTATASDGAFDSGNLPPGEAFSFAFDQPGSFDYVCQYHPGMQGTIVVE